MRKFILDLTIHVHLLRLKKIFMLQRLPKNAYKMVSGRLFISLTRVSDGSNVIVSEFKSNEDLLNVSISLTKIIIHLRGEYVNH